MRRFDAEAGELDLEFVLPHAGELWLLGDRTAVPAIARWVEELAAGSRAQVVIDSDDAALPPIDIPDDVHVDVRRVSGEGALAAAVASLADPSTVALAFVAAEFSEVRAVRAALARVGVEGERVFATSYWRRGDVDPRGGRSGRGLRLIEQSDLLTPNAIRVAATLGLADHITDGAVTVKALAVATSTDAGTLSSLCAHLVRSEVFTSSGDGALGLGPTGRLLVSTLR